MVAMINLIAQIDTNLAQLAGKQLPFAASVALNRTAVGARDKVRDNLPRKFRLRNGWTRGGIQARTSTKSNLVASILAPDYMLIQETGGTRRPSKSRMLAAPVGAASGTSVIPKGKRPRALLGDRAFIIDMGGGNAGVFLRYGKKRGAIKLLWWLSEDQQYEDRFEFEDDVRDYVQDRFSSNFVAAMMQALESGGYAQSASKGRPRIARPEGMSARAWKRMQSKA